MMSEKIENVVINQLLLSRRHTLENLKVLSCLKPEKLKDSFKMLNILSVKPDHVSIREKSLAHAQKLQVMT